MNKIERPEEKIIMKNDRVYNNLIDYFDDKTNGWEKSGVLGYAKRSNSSLINYAVLQGNSLEIWGNVDSHERDKLREIAGEKSKLTKLLEGAKELISLAQTNAKRTYNL